MKIHCTSVHSEKSQTEWFHPQSLSDTIRSCQICELWVPPLWEHLTMNFKKTRKIQSHKLMLQLYDCETRLNWSVILIWVYEWLQSYCNDLLHFKGCDLLPLQSHFECYFGLVSQQRTIIWNNLSVHQC